MKILRYAFRFFPLVSVLALCPALYGASPSCVPYPAGLVSWWKAEGNTLDSISSNTAVPNNITYAAGEVNQAFSLDGTSSYLRVPASASLNVGIGDGLTIEGWIKPGDTSVARPLVEFDNGFDLGVQLWINEPYFGGQGGPGDLFANIGDTSGGTHALVSAPNVLNTASWKHVAVTYDKGSGLGVLYVNGTIVYSYNLGSFTPQTSFDLYIGFRPSPVYSSIYKGLMDEISLYSRALSQAEIQSIVNAESAGKCSDVQLVAPVIVSQPMNVSVAAGSTADFTVSATGSSPLSYQWHFGATDISGATTSVLSLQNVQAADEGAYSVTVSNAVGAVVSSNATLTILQPVAPAIVSQPTNISVIAGSSAQFSVTATGSGPLTYQWHFGSTDVPGGTGNVLSLQHVQVSDEGDYSVTVSNSAGFVVSSNATLSITPTGTNCFPAPAALVSWWKAENNALDSVSGNSGFLSNGVSFAAAEVNQGFNLDGTSGYVRVPASATLDVGMADGFTIEGWVKPADITTARPLVEYNNGTDFGVHLWINEPYFGGQGGPGDVFANIVDTRGGTHALVSLPGVLDTNSWKHVALTYDKASGEGVLYVDSTVVYSYHLGTFTPKTSSDLYLGLRPSPQYPSIYSGLMDEFSVYARSLPQNEIQAIVLAAGRGKCEPAPSAPFIISQPVNQSVSVGSVATFSVGAVGTSPLSYQWFYGTNVLDGQTNNTLLISNVLLSQAGLYSVLVTNELGSALSSSARLSVTVPVTRVFATRTNVSAGSVISFPVFLAANGTENAIGFSLTFNPSLLTVVDVTSPAGDVSVLVNSNQIASGKLGLAFSLPSGSNFAPGTQQLAVVNFNTAITTTGAVANVGFGDQPIFRQVADDLGNSLPVNFNSGSVTFGPVQLEGDVSPRPGGNQAVTITDWVLIGRFAARSDFPTNSSEFQRADCAPRSTAGNGHITVADWVQAGRYAAGLDPLTPAGGPSAEGPSLFAHKNGVNARQLLVSDSVLFSGRSASCPVRLTAQGDESALGFSILFDPSLVTFESAAPGADAATASINVNTNQAASGRLGIVLALPAGRSFLAGSKEVVRLSFFAAKGSTGKTSLSFTDQPVPRESSDAFAEVLPTDYLPGALTLNPLPSLNLSINGPNLRVSWPAWASSFTLNSAISPSSTWAQVKVTPLADANGDNFVILPISEGQRFFRLQK
jgi:hypothetical protein